MRLRWTLLSFAVAVGVPLLMPGTLPPLAQPSPAVTSALGHLTAGVAAVEINELPAQPGATVDAGAVIRTDASGRAKFAFKPQATLQLAGNTELRVEQVVDAKDGRSSALVLEFNRGVARMVAGDGQTAASIAVVRGGGGGLVLVEGGTLDLVASGRRLVAVLRSGRANCRGLSGDMLTMVAGQRACILSAGELRPSAMSPATDRVIDERLSFPPSSVAVSETDADRALVDYAVNDVFSGAEPAQRLPRLSDIEARESLIQTILRQLTDSAER